MSRRLEKTKIDLEHLVEHVRTFPCPRSSRAMSALRAEPMRVLVTGAAGQIGYALAPMIARGAMLGAEQTVILHLLDIPFAAEALEGVRMELVDAAFPLVKGAWRQGKRNGRCREKADMPRPRTAARDATLARDARATHGLRVRRAGLSGVS